MRCAQVGRIVEQFVDGSLDARISRGAAEHARSCPRCAARIAEARRVADALRGAPALHAPEGLSTRVMDAVYREALKGARLQEADGRRLQERGGRAMAAAAGLAGRGASLAAAGRVYRRLGASFVLSAAVLAAFLVGPRFGGQLPGAAGSRTVGYASASPVVVKNAMEGAGLVVRGALYPLGRASAERDSMGGRN